MGRLQKSSAMTAYRHDMWFSPEGVNEPQIIINTRVLGNATSFADSLMPVNSIYTLTHISGTITEK